MLQHLMEEIGVGTLGKFIGAAASVLWLIPGSLFQFTSDRTDQIILSVRNNLGVTQRTRQTKCRCLDKTSLLIKAMHCSHKQESKRSEAGMVASLTQRGLCLFPIGRVRPQSLL